jgi:hypothetical protein
VPEGKYILKWWEFPPGAYLADIRQGARSIMDTGLIVVGKTSAEPLEIVLATGGGKIEGKIQGPAAKLGVASVSLIPQGTRRENQSLIKTTFAPGGTFKITDVPPGDYKLFAWKTLPTGADASAEFMSPYEGRGRFITITAGSTLSNISLPLIEN